LAAIDALPGVEQLSQHENAVCARAMLFPNQYLALKTVCISHSLAHGGMSVAEACALSPLPKAKVEAVYKHLRDADLIVASKRARLG
jgi:hypothetical protein